MKELIEIANNVGVKINAGTAGNSVNNVAGAAPDALGGNALRLMLILVLNWLLKWPKLIHGQ